MILLFHHVSPTSEIPQKNSELYPDEGWRYHITPENLEFQILYFKNRGFNFVHPDVYIDFIKRNGKESKNHMILTFDDGWIDNYIHAFSILKKYNIPAIFFMNSSHLIGNTNKRKISAEQLIELLESNIVIGGHTVSHKILTRITLNEAEKEIRENKLTLESLLNQEVKYFAYPGGAFNESISRITKEIGYTAAFSTLSPAQNTTKDLFWLFRNTFSDKMNQKGDFYRLSPLVIKLFQFRVRKKLQKKLDL